MTLVDILTKELAATKHFETCTFPHFDPAIRCKHGYWLCKVEHDHIHYTNRRGKCILYAADPQFFDKLRKLLVELCRREHKAQAAFEKRLRGQS